MGDIRLRMILRADRSPADRSPNPFNRMLTRTAEFDSVSEKAYRQIRADIIFGKLTPGEKLRLDRLRELYGASVGTLRELLSRLASEGLVVAEGQRGFEVAPIS